MQSVVHSRSVFAVTLGLLMCASVAVPMRAQQGPNSSTISGTVLDQAGKALSGATVTAKSAASGSSGTATSGADGHFSVTGLTTGTYTLETSSPGLDSTIVKRPSPTWLLPFQM